MNKRNGLIARIHIAKGKAVICTECNRLFFGNTCPDCRSTDAKPLDDWRYREILKAVTGEDTSAKLGEVDLLKMLDFFNHAGYRETYPFIASPQHEQKKQDWAVRKRITSFAAHLLGSDWEARVIGFVQKTIGKDSLDHCDSHELRKVIGWLNRYQKYHGGVS